MEKNSPQQALRPAPSQQELLHFLERQAEEKDFAVTDLAQVRRRRLLLPSGMSLDVQFNPARIRSTGAKISAQAIAERPCFLCKKNRPAAQFVLDDGDFEILVNPFPILRRHLTIATRQHVAQDFSLLAKEMCRLAWAWPDFVVFFNGPHSGASAPDHAHLQAGARGDIPVERDWVTLRRGLAPLGRGIYRLHNYACPAYVVTGHSEEEHMALLEELVTRRLPLVACHSPLDYNVLTWREDHVLISVLFPRRKHRPACYGAEGTTQRLISPGAVDMGGLLITPREEDYLQLTAEEAQGILREVTMPFPVSVGLMQNVARVAFCLSGRFLVNGEWEAEGEQLVDAGTEEMHWQGREYASLQFVPLDANATFTLHGVRFGLDFHWERDEDQTFEGALNIQCSAKYLPDAEHHTMCRGLMVINVLPVERYLRCVVASEMRATADIELLKAHAVISRSWLLRQMLPESGFVAPMEPQRDKDFLQVWYDTSTHTDFDICADDHCQRYQGITRLTSPQAAAAVEATEGLVLTSDSLICDARYSKCCGGKTEVFSTCWEDKDVPYLQSVVDGDEDGIFCDTDDEELLSQVLNTYDFETTDFYRWTKEYTQEELSRIIEEKGHLGLGTILQLEPLRRGPSGRISSLRIVGSSRTVTVGKELEIRRLLSPTHLYSSAFDVEKTATGFILHGRGWGHGVGLCQIGAAAMARKGYDFRQILQHYYSGAKLERVY